MSPSGIVSGGVGIELPSTYGLSPASNIASKILHVTSSNSTIAMGFHGPNEGAGISGMQLVRLGEQPTPAFCAGDDSGQACPCGNTGAPGHGCESSYVGSGALLYAGGVASVASDSLFLTTGMMTGNVCFVLQGTAPTEAPIADGLNCLGGSLLRIGTISVNNGFATYPFGSSLPISIKGAIPPAGGTRYYQTTYRNAADWFCPPGTTNRSNGITIQWVP